MRKYIFLILLATSLQSETANDQAFVCFTKSAYMDFIEFIGSERIDSASEMIERGECAKLDKGAKYKVIAKDGVVSFIDVSGIRAWMIEGNK
jgi:hypothetical protein